MNNKRNESFAWCDELEDAEVNCKGKYFKPISKFYFHNFHGYGHNSVDCKKHKFDNDNANSRMHRNTNDAGASWFYSVTTLEFMGGGSKSLGLGFRV